MWGLYQEGSDGGVGERILGETSGIGSYFRVNVENCHSENSQESKKVTLEKTLSNGGHRAWTGHLL